MTTHTCREQFTERASLIDQMLTAVEQRHHETPGPASDEESRAVNAIGVLIAELESDGRHQGIFPRVAATLKTLWQRYEQLSRLPGQEVIAPLQSLLTFDNLCVLDIDVTFQWKQARVEVVRLAAIDRDEQVLFHDALNQERSRMRPVWEELRARLRGRFILAHDLAATQALLASTAHLYGLEAPALIGASFAGLYQEYLAPGYHTFMAMAGSESLSGSPLLDAPDTGQGEQTALGHARHAPPHQTHGSRSVEHASSCLPVFRT